MTAVYAAHISSQSHDTGCSRTLRQVGATTINRKQTGELICLKKVLREDMYSTFFINLKQKHLASITDAFYCLILTLKFNRQEGPFKEQIISDRQYVEDRFGCVKII